MARSHQQDRARVSLRHLISAAIYLTVAGAFSGCEDDPPPPPPVDTTCEPGDPVSGLNCECVGAECVCPSSGDCAIYCIDNCDLQCAGSGSCDVLCDAACDVACTGPGNCASEVVGGSTVNCTGSGDCDVVCHGDCTVECPGSATCTVTCAPTATCELDIKSCSGEVTECPENTLVCNGDCP